MKELEKYFVSFEMAVKLKEIGYNGFCLGYYENQDKKLIIRCHNVALTAEQLQRANMYKTENTNKTLPQWATSAPTYEQVLDWFREELKINIDPYTAFQNEHPIGYSVLIKLPDDDYVSIESSHDNSKVFQTYYEAVIAGIEEVFKIK